jgi:predicted phosphodiesterase
MQIAVISDLHLGPGDPSDSFGHDDATFGRFLDRLESNFERIILLGDIWETLTSTRLYDLREGLRRAKEAHPSLASRFEKNQYEYVHGNHDWISREVDASPSEMLIDADGLRLVFTHGHHHDFLVRRARWVSECSVWLGGWARRLGLGALYRVGYDIDAWLSKPKLGPTLDSFQRWAFGLARLRAADVVVTGHTHVPHLERSQGRVFLNSGTCSEGHLTYLSIDTRQQTFAIAREQP